MHTPVVHCRTIQYLVFMGLVSHAEFFWRHHKKCTFKQLTQSPQGCPVFQCTEDRSHNWHFIPAISEHVEVANVSFTALWSLLSSRTARYFLLIFFLTHTDTLPGFYSTWKINKYNMLNQIWLIIALTLLKKLVEKNTCLLLCPL